MLREPSVVALLSCALLGACAPAPPDPGARATHASALTAVEQAKLVASDGAPVDFFGRVAVSGDTALVTAKHLRRRPRGFRCRIARTGSIGWLAALVALLAFARRRDRAASARKN